MTKPLVGTWHVNYPVYSVASLDKDQAMCLLHGSKGRDRSDNWILYDGRDLKVTIDYPLRKSVKFTVKAMLDPYQEKYQDLGLFLLEVARKYKEIYRAPRKYGIWGHSLEDLVFEAVTVKKNGSVELAVGS